MKMRSYPAYKPSGMGSVGEVPEHWEVRRLKSIARSPIENGIGEASIHDNRDWPRYIRITDIANSRKLRSDTFKSLPPTLAAKAIVETHDILFAAVGATYGKSYYHTSDEVPSACFAGYLVRFSPDVDLVLAAFVAYWAESHVYWMLIRSRVIQATIENFSASKYRNLPIPYPPLAEQQPIVVYLDQETSKIDALIDKTRALIHHLQEKRRTLITETVTRGLLPDQNRKAGLDPCPKLMPSGVGWLGDVPEHWKTQRLRSVTTRADKAAAGSEGEEHAYIGMENVESWTGKLPDATAMSLKVASPSSRGFRRGDVLFGKLRPDLAKSCSPDFDGLCSGEFLVLEGNDDLDNRYLLYLLLSQYMVAMADAAAYGTKMPRTNWQEIGSLPVPVPPTREQRAICSYLDGATARIDNLVRHAQVLVDRLREKRQALITAAVTGQIDVRGEEETTE